VITSTSVEKPALVHTTTESSVTPKYHSLELEQIQARPTSPFGMQFFSVPVSSAPVTERKEATTRTCDETSYDGKSVLDCIDDDD